MEPGSRPEGGAERARELDDLTLRRAQRGDEPASRELVNHYQRPVFALLGRLLCGAGKRGLVEDLAQETFLRVFHALPRFVIAGPARPSTWILTIATRVALDELRRGRPRVARLRDAAAAPARGRPDEIAARRALVEAIERAAAALPAETRAVFLLRECHDLDYQEIAAALALDLGTVKSRLFRARAAIRAALDDGEEVGDA